MPSPFPGMNPYLEHSEVWHDFHESLIPRIRDALNVQVGDDYLVKLEEHIYIEEVADEHSRALVRMADVSISQQRGTVDHTGTVAAVLESPAQVVPLLVEEFTECYVEVRDRRSRTLVTVIELLSPSNKSGKDRNQYLAKRDQILKSSAHLVEIDLLRGGERLPFQTLPACDYYVMVSRDQQRPPAQFWPILLSEPLPEIPIPLKEGDPDLRLDLQRLLHETYDAAGYGKFIYDNELSPPLPPHQMRWLAEVLAHRVG